MDAAQELQLRTGTKTDAEFDAIVIGAGVAGLYQLYRLRELAPAGARVRSRKRGRRHLVLEPLSRRPFRF